jgi:hypothetical protein
VQSKASDHLVEDEQSPVLAGDPAKKLKESGIGRDATAVAQHRFADYRGDFGCLAGEDSFDGLRVVPVRDENIGVSALSRACAHRRSVSGCDFRGGWVIADQDAVVPAMIVALELHELGASRGGACQAQGYLDNFRAAVCNTYQITARYNFNHSFSNLKLEIMLGPVSKTVS